MEHRRIVDGVVDLYPVDIHQVVVDGVRVVISLLSRRADQVVLQDVFQGGKVCRRGNAVFLAGGCMMEAGLNAAVSRFVQLFLADVAAKGNQSSALTKYLESPASVRSRFRCFS